MQVAPVIVVDHALLHLDGDPAERVDGFLEGFVADDDHMVNLQVAQQVADGFHQQSGTAERVRGVDFAPAVAGDAHERIARDGERVDALVHKVHLRDEDGVRARHCIDHALAVDRGSRPRRPQGW
jgi:hypothetical protein